MKSTFLNSEKDVCHFMELALAEYSDPQAQAVERKWIIDDRPGLADLRLVTLGMYHCPPPMTAEAFQALLVRLKIREPKKETCYVIPPSRVPSKNPETPVFKDPF